MTQKQRVTEMDRHIGRNLASTMREAGTTAEILASAVGVDRGDVDAWIAGSSRLKPLAMLTVVQVLQIRVSRLYEGLNVVSQH